MNRSRDWLKTPVMTIAAMQPTAVAPMRNAALRNAWPRRGWARIATVTAEDEAESSCSQNAAASASIMAIQMRVANAHSLSGMPARLAGTGASVLSAAADITSARYGPFASSAMSIKRPFHQAPFASTAICFMGPGIDISGLPRPPRGRWTVALRCCGLSNVSSRILSGGIMRKL